MKLNILILFAMTWTLLAETDSSPRLIALENQVARMEINRFGGAISSFVLHSQKLNPYTWVSGKWKSDDISEKQGLFVCFDRMGFPSAEEQNRGIPFHGEATSVEWTEQSRSITTNGDLRLVMKCKLPLAQMTLTREYRLFNNSSVCRISDTLTNNNSFRKPFNIMQHPTLAPPFLTDKVRVDCNAGHGFLNTRDPETMPGPLYPWPTCTVEQTPVDMRFNTHQVNACLNYITAPKTSYGWGTICNAPKGLLAGNLWSTEEYPWLRVWRSWKNDEPASLAIEFSTTPFGIALDDIIAKGDVLKTSTIEFLAPSESVTKTFYTFLAEIPTDFKGVDQVFLDKEQLTIKETGSGQTIQLPVQSAH